MPYSDLHEKRFEQDIEEFMITSGGLVRFSLQDETGTWHYNQAFDRDKNLIPMFWQILYNLRNRKRGSDMRIFTAINRKRSLPQDSIKKCRITV